MPQALNGAQLKLNGLPGWFFLVTCLEVDEKSDIGVGLLSRDDISLTMI